MLTQLMFKHAESGDVRVLDIGCGANLIYPLLGSAMHGWSFVAADITDVAVTWARANLRANPQLEALIEVRDVAHEDAVQPQGALITIAHIPGGYYHICSCCIWCPMHINMYPCRPPVPSHTMCFCCHAKPKVRPCPCALCKRIIFSVGNIVRDNMYSLQTTC